MRNSVRKMKFSQQEDFIFLINCGYAETLESQFY